MGSNSNYKSNLWISPYYIDQHRLTLLPDQRPLTHQSLTLYNLEQFQHQDAILALADTRGRISAWNQRFASNGTHVAETDQDLASDLALASKAAAYGSPYWDTADNYLDQFGITVPDGAAHTAGYYNTEQLGKLGQRFSPQICCPFNPTLIGPERNDSVKSTIRRYLFTLSEADRQEIQNVWGTSKSFGNLRIQIRPEAKAIQVIDTNGCSSHWYNISDAINSKSALKTTNLAMGTLNHPIP